MICCCDIPDIPTDLVAQLAAAITKTGAQAAYASDSEAHHYLLTLVNPSFGLTTLRNIVSSTIKKERKKYSIRGWLESMNAVAVNLEIDTPLVNINCEDDIRQFVAQQRNTNDT